MALLKDISDLLRISLCFLSSIVVLIAGYVTFRLNNIVNQNSSSQNFVQFIFLNDRLPFEGILLGLVIPFLLIAGTHVINDYFDYANDKINQRLDRPLVRGTITPQIAMFLAAIFYLVSFIISILLVVFYNLTFLLILAVLLFIILGVGYNTGIKKYGFIGNLWVSIGYVAPFLMGALLVGIKDNLVILNIIILSCFILSLALGREILKDIMDIKGDLETGKRSVAIILGSRSAAIISGLIYLIGMILGASLLFLAFKNNWIFLPGYALLVLLIIFTLIIVIRDPSLENAIKGRKYTRWSLWWATALIFFSSLIL